MLNNNKAVIKTMDLGTICSRGEQSAWQNYSAGRRESALVPHPAEYRTGADLDDGAFFEAPAAHNRKQRAAAARIEKAMTYMLRNLNGTVRMSALSKLAGISTSSFYQLFKLATGCSPNDFFIRARMRHACGLLQETDLSVKEVAALMGYDDPFYFSRLFKSVNGVAPRAYRVSLDGFENPKARKRGREQSARV